MINVFPTNVQPLVNTRTPTGLVLVEVSIFKMFLILIKLSNLAEKNMAEYQGSARQNQLPPVEQNAAVSTTEEPLLNCKRKHKLTVVLRCHTSEFSAN